MKQQQTVTFEEPTRRVVRPMFGTPVPQPACDSECCATVPPPSASGITRRAETIVGVGPKLSPQFGVAVANDNALARVRRQRDEVVRLTTAVLDGIATWQRARDAETRAALRGLRTPELAQATRDAEATLLELEDLSAAAEATLAILERSK
jgi:hypothetical protein